jgi:hypothetical protein
MIIWDAVQHGRILARVRALLRRTSGSGQSPVKLTLGDVELICATNSGTRTQTLPHHQRVCHAAIAGERMANRCRAKNFWIGLGLRRVSDHAHGGHDIGSLREAEKIPSRPRAGSRTVHGVGYKLNCRGRAK